MSEKNENKEKPKGSNKRYIALALVVILGIIGIMMNNNTQQEATDVAITETLPVAEQAQVAEEPTIARIDIFTKLVDVNIPQMEVYVDDAEEPEKQVGWMTKYDSQGYVIQKDHDHVDITIKTLADGKIQIVFKGPWEKDENGNMVKHWVKYTSILVNNEEILSEPITTWHNKSFKHVIDAKTGDEIKINAKWIKYIE